MVIEFDPQGRVKMLFGRKPEAVEGGAPPPPGVTPPPPPPGCSQPLPTGFFNRPTDVAWDGREIVSWPTDMVIRAL